MSLATKHHGVCLIDVKVGSQSTTIHFLEPTPRTYPHQSGPCDLFSCSETRLQLAAIIDWQKSFVVGRLHPAKVDGQGSLPTRFGIKYILARRHTCIAFSDSEDGSLSPDVDNPVRRHTTLLSDSAHSLYGQPVGHNIYIILSALMYKMNISTRFV